MEKDRHIAREEAPAQWYQPRVSNAGGDGRMIVFPMEDLMRIKGEFRSDRAALGAGPSRLLTDARRQLYSIRVANVRVLCDGLSKGKRRGIGGQSNRGTKVRFLGGPAAFFRVKKSL